MECAQAEQYARHSHVQREMVAAIQESIQKLCSSLQEEQKTYLVTSWTNFFAIMTWMTVLEILMNPTSK